MVPVAEIYRIAGRQQPAKKEATMHLGIAMPLGDIGGDGPIVREFAELAEAEGYEGLVLPDHVLGGNPKNPASGRAGGLGLFHDPFVAFGFVAACTKKVELSTQVLILAQLRRYWLPSRLPVSRCSAAAASGLASAWAGTSWSSSASTRISTIGASGPRNRSK